MEVVDMRQLSVEEFFEKVDIWYNDEDGTLTLKYDGHMVWDIDGNIVHNSSDNVLFYSDYAHNKKIFMNTGTYNFMNSMESNLNIAQEAYKNSMIELEKRIEEMENIQINVCRH